ncbi:glycosyl transferase family protein [Hyalangium versicolor]|uniref:glycosyl transferase family protein n=1 Tax=Hyalangium versicolor TaxID=2861190 RepID=UPI001CCB5230|nr:glycosyl transferase family protein [Hyalangium versicolor]
MDTLDTVAHTLAYPISIGIFLNGLDELWIDLNFFLRGLHRRERRTLSLEELRAVAQRRIAIMVPAWQEANVIQQMLEHNLRSLDYELSNYDFFLGTYPNDKETQARVDAVSRVHPNVHKVVLPHDGPTSKADCLNWVYQGIVLEEQRSGRRFDTLLMHDAEDVIHPLSLRLCSLLIPRHEFVQMPVFSLELPKSNLVGATYIDEFAEHHLRDMPVREALHGLIPSAGVGSAFDRNAFEDIAGRHGQQPFSTSSLTEDYEIGLKFRLAGKRVHFACRTLTHPAQAPGPSSAGVPEREEYLATREYFPDNLWASVRQRSRWILGITLQTWQQLGWQGTLPVLYCLWRDRKALLTNALLLGAYGLLAYVFARTSVSATVGEPWSMDDVAPKDSWLAWILVINLLLLVWRLGMKFYAVNRLYGPGHALMSVPRLMLGNLISLMATNRAIFQFVRHRVTGQPLRWLKTTHAFPNTGALAAQHEPLDACQVAGEVISQLGPIPHVSQPEEPPAVLATSSPFENSAPWQASRGSERGN